MNVSPEICNQDLTIPSNSQIITEVIPVDVEVDWIATTNAVNRAACIWFFPFLNTSHFCSKDIGGGMESSR